MNLNERIHKAKGHIDEVCYCDVCYGDVPHDYLNDKASTLDALIELITNGVTITECQCEDGCYGIDIFFKGVCRHATSVEIPTAIWTAFCELKESTKKQKEKENDKPLQ